MLIACCNASNSIPLFCTIMFYCCSLGYFSRAILNIQQFRLSYGIIMYIRRLYEHNFKHRLLHTAWKIDVNSSLIWSIFKVFSTLQNRPVCVLGRWGWGLGAVTLQITRTHFLWNTRTLFKWTGGAFPWIWIPYIIWGKINALYKLINVSDWNGLRTFIIMHVLFVILLFVLSILRNSLLAFNHYIILFNTLLMTEYNSCKCFELYNNRVP